MPFTRHADHEIRPRRVAGLVALAAVVIGVPVTLSAASFTSQSSNTASVQAAADWTPPIVTLVDPGLAIRGTVTLSATATDAETGIAQVAIGWAPSGTTTWTTLCTRTVAPYTCTFNTIGLPEDDVDLRAVATDRSGYTTTSFIEGVLVDNVAPTGALAPIPTPLSGTVTISASASDAGSGVGSVTVQYAPNGTATWTSICTDTTAPWSCRFNTALVPDGSYSFRAIIADGAGNVTTTATVTNRQVDNRQSSISMEDPGPFLRGIETLTASPFSNVGITSVRIQRNLAGTSTWVDVCTVTTAPYSCTWDTRTVADGNYNFRAILVDGNGVSTTSAVVGPTRVDNNPVRGADVQAANGGPTVGKLEAGDTITFTYSEVLNPSSILAGWSGGSQTVGVRVRDGGLLSPKLGSADDTLDVFTNTAITTPVSLGSVNLKGDFLKGGKSAVFSATMTATTVTLNGQPVTAVTVRLDAMTAGSGIRTSGGTPAMVWTPSSAAFDLAGNQCSTAPVTESGTADKDF